MIGLHHYIFLSAMLFTVGIVGILIRRNALMILLCLEIIFNAANLSLVAFSHYSGNLSGQVLVFFVMTISAAEVAIGLAILIIFYRNKGSLDTDMGKTLKW
ncbi:MAG: NADH-quinone oxidoreductase subunit NuoK [Chlamydiota bacterium]|nr:NADH-quinone oxidoreductase subunit NuoK [Chlamydiota bacterium]